MAGNCKRKSTDITCMKESSFMLTLLIPGPKSPSKDIDVYLRPLVYELKMLWAEGVQVRDASTKTVFRMHAALLWTINDYPARSSLSGWSGQDVKDMYEANEEVVKILCNLEMIYPPAFFDIMVHLILHLPEEAILDEALTFCSMYLDGMQTKFNRPDRNADAGIPKRQFQVFFSQCRPISKKKIKALSEHANKSLQWFVLNNCDEIKAYKSEFESKFPERNMQTDFSSWLKYEANVFSFSSSSSTPDKNELRALAHGPLYASSYTACIVNGVRFVVQNRDSRRTTQNSGVVTIGEDDTPFYGQLEEIIELNYIDGYSVVLFRCKWFNTRGKRLIKQNNTTIIDIGHDWYVDKEWYDDVQYILATQAKQVFYLRDPSRTTGQWRVVEDVHHRKLWDHPTVVNEIDILHDTQSNDYTLVVDTGCEGGESSHVGGESSHVGYLPMRTTLNEGGDPSNVASIDLDESFINDDEEDAYNSDDEDELNDDDEEDDDVVDTRYFRKMATMAQSHGGDGGDGGPYHFDSGCATGSGELHGGGYKFVGPNASDFIRAISLEVEKVVPPYYPNWAKVPIEKKRAVYPTLIDYFDLDSWRNTDKWRGVELGITAECQRAYKDHKRVLKVHFEENGGYNDVGAALNNPPEDVDQETWETLINELFLDASYKNRSTKNKQNRSQQRYPSYHGSKSYSQRRHMEGTGPTDVFKSTHYKEGTGWANTNVSSDYVKEYTRSSAESGGDSSAVDEIACMERALGHRRGHIRGVGRVVSNPTPDLFSTSPPQPHWQEVDGRVTQLQQQVQDQQQREAQRDEERRVHNQQMLEMQRQMDEMRRMWERRTSSDDN
ncbi:hypothetical protein L1987_70329 [Smallanthus sonchifolius]|uniref:Uncharacterized protein n=1 Tax=Smallanthus sonchifolius TaxID=185202 RepID=A0ACB9AQW8_9ASTR|nr:hypothetical protein L1987_70329 [Smallanthus sonchifolius]